MRDTPGLDLLALRGYLDRTHPGLIQGELGATLIQGGKSNLTYAVTDGASTWVVRRPPLGHVLNTAHDMAREARVLSALLDTSVPVPCVIELCQEATVLGAPFYVMSYVPGRALRSAAELAELGPERVRAISRHTVETLALLHGIDPAEVGLADFGRPQGFLVRQVNRWGRQLDHSSSRPVPSLNELGARLAKQVPNESSAAIVHGDYRLDNLLLDGDDKITAVLDWEMATVGDPLTDLGLLLAYERVAGLVPDLPDSSDAPGFLRGAELVQTYEAARETSVPPLTFYVALACFKLAVILEGVHYRHIQGMTTGEGFQHIGKAVEPVAQLGLSVLEGMP